MAESNAADDLRQLAAHLASLRLAGLTELPKIDMPDDTTIFDAPTRKADQTRTPVEANLESQSTRPKLPDETSDGTPQPVSRNRETAQREEIPPTLPGLAETRPEIRKRPSPASARKPVTTPVTAFFDSSRVPIESPVVPPDQRPELLRVLGEEVAACTRCPHLAATRTQTVFQSGTPSARLMFIGEAPGADEDRLGEPFVGRAGQLLTDIVNKGMGLSRSEIYIANILKCRPPENRNPLPDEMANCRGYLDRQIEIVRPEFICLLGKVAVGAILETSVPMKNLRLRWHRYRDIPTIVTWHPAYLLRNPAAKKDTWEDIKMLMAEMGLKPPTKD